MIQDGYGFCANAWALDTRIKNELALLVIISSMTAKTGETYARNKFFAEMFNCTEVSISNKISKLAELGYIEVEYEMRGCEIKKRIIRLKKFLTDEQKKFYPTIKKDFNDNTENLNSENFNNINNKNIIKKVGSKFSVKTNQVIIDKNFSANKYDELKVYVQEMPEDVIRSVENWLIKSKLGQPVDCAFIAKQFINFAKRQGRPFFKEGV